MLKVFFDTDNIGMITDMLDAEEHSHYPIQLFLSVWDMTRTFSFQISSFSFLPIALSANDRNNL